ncbi:MAG: hypothetical protein QNJ11_02300 [Woeseiaceae bacterium]|nr:hypothetical protein [Woeseiaceae bacterium]
MKRSIVALALMFLAAISAFAQEETEPAFRIAYDVNVPDEDARERIGMYLRNELRSLGDVEITDENPDYKLFVMVMEMNSERGNRMAYILGISVASFFPDGYFNTVLDDRINNVGEVARRLEEVPVYEQQLMSLAGPEEAHLIQTVSNSIAQLNRHVLEPRRQPKVRAEAP